MPPSLSTPTPKTPSQIFTELGLFERVGGVPKLTAKSMEDFAERRTGFDWIHMGTTSLPIARVAEVIRANPRLSPPRSGHMGNWGDVVRGRAGTLDYNLYVCGIRQLGHPILFDLNKTEDAALQDGDWIYLPGSLVERGVRTELRLFTWDGHAFVERTHEHAWFTPFVFTPIDGELVPLTRLHRRRCAELGGFDFRYGASLIRTHEPLVRGILHELLEVIRARPNPDQAFEPLLDRAVGLEGRVQRLNVQLEGRGYRVGDTFYEDTLALVEATLLPFQAATDPDQFFARLGQVRGWMPLASIHFINLLYGLLNSHYPDGPIDRSTMTQPCTPHLHWGALGMAGYPPKRSGYFREKVKSARDFSQLIIERFAEVDPVLYVLLPASIFMLCPSDAFPADVELVERLIHRLHQQTDRFAGKANLLVSEIDRIVAEWVAEARPALSPYYLNRFTGRRSVLNTVPLPESSQPVEPRGFDTLTLQQAAVTVGALLECLGGS